MGYLTTSWWPWIHDPAPRKDLLSENPGGSWGLLAGAVVAAWRWFQRTHWNGQVIISIFRLIVYTILQLGDWVVNGQWWTNTKNTKTWELEAKSGDTYHNHTRELARNGRNRWGCQCRKPSESIVRDSSKSAGPNWMGGGKWCHQFLWQIPSGPISGGYPVEGLAAWAGQLRIIDIHATWRYDRICVFYGEIRAAKVIFTRNQDAILVRYIVAHCSLQLFSINQLLIGS